MTLYILGSPIGNLNDVSYRYLEVLSKLKYLVVEDTNKARKLLQLLQKRYPDQKLDNKELIAYYREVESKRITQILNLLKEGRLVGLLSEAGMPGISDPGNLLVDSVQRYGFSIEPVPGPSALTTALSLSGFSGKYCLFLGFIPKTQKDKRKLFQQIDHHNLAQSLNVVFFESPKRIRESVSICQDLWPKARLFLGNDLTKKNQSLVWSRLDKINLEQIKEKGEYTGVLYLKK